MCFRTTIKSIKLSLCVVCVVLMGCARDAEPQRDSITIEKTQQTQCLSEVTERVERYLDGASTAAEVTQFWGCMQNAVRLFREYVRGRSSDAYDPTEIRAFLHDFFLGDIRLNDALLSEFMVLKRLFVGGATDRVTFAELDQTQVFLRKLQDLSLTMLPHMPVLSLAGESMAPATTISEADWRAAEIALEQVGQELATMIGPYDYNSENLTRFFVEMADLFVSQDPDSALVQLKQLAPILMRVKSMTVGPNLQRIQVNEWPRFLRLITEGYSLWNRYYRFIDNGDWRQGRGLTELQWILDRAVLMLQKGLSARSTSAAFTTEEFNALLSKIDAWQEFTGLFGLSSIQLAFTWVRGKLLPKLDPTLSADESMNEQKLGVLQQEMRRWLAAQASIPNLLLSGLVQVASGSVEMLRAIANAPWPLMNDSMGRVQIGAEGLQHNLESLTLINIERLVVRWLILAYATEDSRKNDLVGLTQREMRQAYRDLKPLLVDMELVDASNRNFYSRVFRDANLFLPRSNGNEWVEYEEGIEYVHYVLSGTEVAFELKQMLSFCRNNDDTFNSPCLQQSWQDTPSTLYPALPQLGVYLRQLDPTAWQSFFKDVNTTARFADVEEDWSSGELIEKAVLMQYLETVLHRFDQDGDSFWSVQEAIQYVFPVFRFTLRNLLNLDSEEEVLAYLTYLLAFGEPPDPFLDPLHEIQFRHWQVFPELWEFRAERRSMMKVLATLTELTR